MIGFDVKFLGLPHTSMVAVHDPTEGENERNIEGKEASIDEGCDNEGAEDDEGSY